MAAPTSLRRLAPIFFSLLVSVGPIIACATTGDATVPPADEPDTGTPEPTASLPPPSGHDAAGSSDATNDGPKDSGKDVQDAGKDTGPPAPNPGDACMKDQELFSRSCGKCGKQQALCLGGIVTDYGPCENEAGICVPGEMMVCGNCGKQTCTSYCAWGACTGQPVNSCAPTTVEYTTAGCATPETYRNRTCGAMCSWGPYSATCDEPQNANKLFVPPTVNGVVSANYTLTKTQIGPRVTGSCPAGTVSATTDHSYELVEVRNNTAQTATVSVWLSGTPAIDTVMHAYQSILPPPAGNLGNCKWGVNDFCPSTVPCGDSLWSGLTGSQALVLPPGKGALVRFGSYYQTSSGSLTTGPVTFSVRTDSLL